MPRVPRQLEPRAVYHVTARGNDRARLVFDDDDRRRFRRVLRTVAEQEHWGVLAWCLMDNHFHLIVLDRTGTLSRGMQRLQLDIVSGYRRRYGGSGHLFQGRYGLRRISSWTYLLAGVRYCLRNPVEAGLVDRATDWPWSSARALAGLGDAEEWLLLGPILRATVGADVPRAEAVAEFLA